MIRKSILKIMITYRCSLWNLEINHNPFTSNKSTFPGSVVVLLLSFSEFSTLVCCHLPLKTVYKWRATIICDNLLQTLGQNVKSYRDAKTIYQGPQGAPEGSVLGDLIPTNLLIDHVTVWLKWSIKTEKHLTSQPRRAPRNSCQVRSLFDHVVTFPSSLLVK